VPGLTDRDNDEIKWRGRLIFLSAVLAKEPVGLSRIDEYCWELHYSSHLLGHLDGRTGDSAPAQGWHNMSPQET